MEGGMALEVLPRATISLDSQKPNLTVLGNMGTKLYSLKYS